MTAYDDVNDDLPATESGEPEPNPAEKAADTTKPEGWQEKVEQVKQEADKIKDMADKLRDRAA